MKLNHDRWRWWVCGLLPAILCFLSPAGAARAQGDNRLLPVLTLRVVDAEASEAGLDRARFEVHREGPTNEVLLVGIELRGNALNGIDYAPLLGVVTVPAGARSIPVVIEPLDDDLVEGVEEVVAELQYPPVLSPLPPNFVIGSPSNGVVRIFDNDTLPVITVRATDAEAAEPGVLAVIESGAFTIARSGATNQDLPVFIRLGGTASNGVDYVTISNVVVIPAGALSAPVRVDPLHDLLAEGTETVVLHLLPVACPAIWPPPRGCYVVGTPAEAVVRIRDNGEPPRTVVTIEAVDPEGSEIPVVPPGLGMPQRVDPVVFMVSRTGDTNIPLTVWYSVGGTASNGVDYDRLSGALTIPAGARRAPLEVLPLDDSLVEGTETVVVKLEEPVCIAIWPPPPECYRVGLPAEAAGRILDNDPQPNRPPTVTLTRPREGETFVLPAAVRIRADALDADGYVPHIEFYAGEEKIGEQTRYFFMAPPPGQHQVFEMVWTNPPAGRHALWARAVDNQGESGRSDPVTIWVVRPDEPPVHPLPVVSITAPDPVASEGTNHLRWTDWTNRPEPGRSVTNIARFVVRRTGPTNTARTVFYAVGGTALNGVDYAELPGALTIPAGRRSAEIRIVPVDDSVPEKLETIVLRLRVPPATTDAQPPYLIGWPARAGAVIVDNDQPRPGPGLLADQCFHLGLPAANGECFRIEWSSDLIHWTPLGTNVVVDGALHFVDPDADEAEQRFYRAVPEPAPAPEVE